MRVDIKSLPKRQKNYSPNYGGKRERAGRKAILTYEQQLHIHIAYNSKIKELR